MYGETGVALRCALAELLQQVRVQRTLGTTTDQRGQRGQQILQFRQTILTWGNQAMRSTAPLTFSNRMPVPSNPFRHARMGYNTPAAQLARALDVTTSAAGSRPATADELSTDTRHPLLERWREAARAAALAEHDTAPDIAIHMTVPQAQAVVADVAAVAQAIVVLDARYVNTPGWEPLARASRLGWAALAAAIDMNLGQPDYTVDELGWRPRVKLIDGPARPGVFGVLQAEHNLVVRMRTFPNAINLRFVVDSQRLLSNHLAPFAARVDTRLAARWEQRASSHTALQQQLRRIGGRAGRGAFAAAEGANAVSRIRALPSDSILEPTVLGGFQLLFNRLDSRIADVIEDGIDNRAYFQRKRLPRLVVSDGALVAPVRERFVPVDRAENLELIETVREHLRPAAAHADTTPGQSRADLHHALLRVSSRQRAAQAADFPML